MNQKIKIETVQKKKTEDFFLKIDVFEKQTKKLQKNDKIWISDTKRRIFTEMRNLLICI